MDRSLPSLLPEALVGLDLPRGRFRGVLRGLLPISSPRSLCSPQAKGKPEAVIVLLSDRVSFISNKHPAGYVAYDDFDLLILLPPPQGVLRSPMPTRKKKKTLFMPPLPFLPSLTLAVLPLPVLLRTSLRVNPPKAPHYAELSQKV